MERIGVFVCWCGSNIAATVDVVQVAQTLEKNRGLSTPQSILICVPRPDKTWSWRPSGSTALPVW